MRAAPHARIAANKRLIRIVADSRQNVFNEAQIKWGSRRRDPRKLKRTPLQAAVRDVDTSCVLSWAQRSEVGGRSRDVRAVADLFPA